MIDHLSIPVRDLDASAEFYDAVLQTLGLVRTRQHDGAVGYGRSSGQAPVFWVLAIGASAATPGPGLHISFEARDRDAVDAFHAAGIALGGRDAGSPGERPQYTQPFYGAFLLDPDGFKVEAVCRL